MIWYSYCRSRHYKKCREAGLCAVSLNMFKWTACMNVCDKMLCQELFIAINYKFMQKLQGSHTRPPSARLWYYRPDFAVIWTSVTFSPSSFFDVARMPRSWVWNSGRATRRISAQSMMNTKTCTPGLPPLLTCLFSWDQKSKACPQAHLNIRYIKFCQMPL